MDKSQLRKELRQQRRDLDYLTQQSYSGEICRYLRLNPWIQAAKHIGLFIPNDGEPDILELLDYAVTSKKFLYLPCLNRLGRPQMVYRVWSPGELLTTNRYGIPEPRRGRSFPTWALSVVLVPLVAFDLQGNRLGMGAGFYDRTIQFRRGNKRKLPRLIGVAYDFQEVPAIEAQDWDIPLDLVVTNTGVVNPKSLGSE